MYTVQETFAEMKNPALSVPGSSMAYASFNGRVAYVWTAYAEKHGVDCLQTVIRFFENREWVDTWYPVDRETADQLAMGWINGSDEVKERIAAALA